MEYPIWRKNYTRLSNRIVPLGSGATSDTLTAGFALLEDFYLQGGYRVCKTREERNAISYDRRKVGMIAYVLSGTTSGSTYFSGNTFWMLNHEPVPEPVYAYNPNIKSGTTDTDWTQLCLFCTTPPPPGPYWTVTPSSREIPTDGSYTSDFTVNFYNWVLPTVWWITEPAAGTTFTLSDGSPYYLNLYSGSTDGSTFKASGTTMTYDKGYRDATIVVWATGGTFKNVQIYQNPLDYNPPVMTQFEIAGPYIVEIGTTISSRNFTWTNSFSENVRATPYADFQISGDGLPSPIVSLPKSSPSNTLMNSTLSFTGLVRTTPGTKGPWTITGYDILGNSSNLTRQSSLITWQYPIFWGKNVNTTLTESEILALNKITSPSYNVSLDFSNTGPLYYYFATPLVYNEFYKTWSVASNGNLSMVMSYLNKRFKPTVYNNMSFYTIDLTINSVIITYRVYRSMNPLSSGDTIIITEV